MKPKKNEIAGYNHDGYKVSVFFSDGRDPDIFSMDTLEEARDWVKRVNTEDSYNIEEYQIFERCRSRWDEEHCKNILIETIQTKGKSG